MTTQPSLSDIKPPEDAAPIEIERVRTPLWRRLTALISLGSLVVIIGVLVAVILGVSALLVLVLLERAAAG